MFDPQVFLEDKMYGAPCQLVALLFVRGCAVRRIEMLIYASVGYHKSLFRLIPSSLADLIRKIAWRVRKISF